MSDGPLERSLRHERLLVAGGLLAVIVLSWAWLLAGAGTMQEMDGMLMPMSAAPMILLYATVARGRRAGGERSGNAGVFAAGYAAVWIGFSIGAVALQFALERAALLSPMMETTSMALAGTVLVAAGVYQWLPLKQACLRRCRSPLEFILLHWREGTRGAFRMGATHGMYCVGCCWMLMLLLFVGGIMNLAWIAGLALFVLLEKLMPAGHWIGRIAGVALVAWGIAVLLAPA